MKYLFEYNENLVPLHDGNIEITYDFAYVKGDRLEVLHATGIARDWEYATAYALAAAVNYINTGSKKIIKEKKESEDILKNEYHGIQSVLASIKNDKGSPTILKSNKKDKPAILASKLVDLVKTKEKPQEGKGYVKI